MAQKDRNVGERQETSVMASIQDILRDAQAREEQEKLDAERRIREEEQRRVDEARRQQEAEEARVRAEEEDRQLRAHAEQKRQAELSALQEAAVQKARMEAESKARLAEMTSRQEHERQLHALSQDEHKKKLQMGLAGLGVLILALAIGGGMAIKNSMDQTAATEARLRDLQAQQDQAQAEKKRLEEEIRNAQATNDPAKILELNRQLAQAQEKINTIKVQRGGGGGGGGAKPAGGGGGGGGGPKPACTCQAGDPLCSCL